MKKIYTLKNLSWPYLSLLIMVTLLILTKGISQGGFWFSDASRHAMDGIFILDFIKDFPVFHIYDYITQYYAKYPALGIGYYPPFFAMVEAMFYALFGFSILTARVTVIFFAVIAVIFWFKLIKLIFNERIAFYSSLLFITTPFIVKWSKATMLEMPALAMIILSVYFFYNFIELNKRRHGYYMILATVTAIYTKQTAVFLFLFYISYLVVTGRRKMFFDKYMIFLSLGLVLLILPLVIFTLKFGNMNLTQSVGGIEDQLRLLSLRDWLFYPKALTKTLTMPVLMLSIIFIGVHIFKRDSMRTKFFLPG